MAYTLMGRKGGVVRFEPFYNGVVTDETIAMPSKVTSNPIEDGSTIEDHTAKDPKTFNISGILVGGEAAAKALEKLRDDADLVTYTGRRRIDNLAFTNLQLGYKSNNADGCSFQASFTRVTTTAPEMMDVGKVPMMSAQDKGKAATQQAAKTASAGKTQPLTATISDNAYTKYTAQYYTAPGKPSPSPANPGWSGAVQ